MLFQPPGALPVIFLTTVTNLLKTTDGDSALSHNNVTQRKYSVSENYQCKGVSACVPRIWWSQFMPTIESSPKMHDINYLGECRCGLCCSNGFQYDELIILHLHNQAIEKLQRALTQWVSKTLKRWKTGWVPKETGPKDRPILSPPPLLFVFWIVNGKSSFSPLFLSISMPLWLRDRKLQVAILMRLWIFFYVVRTIQF